MALDGRVGTLQATSLADAEKTYAKGATKAEVNAELCELQTYARGEAATASATVRGANDAQMASLSPVWAAFTLPDGG